MIFLKETVLLNTLFLCLRYLHAESESVRLGATRDLLDRAGFRPVDRHEIVKEKSVEELNAQLVSLVGDDGAEMLISAFRSRKSISGPELAG